MKPLFICYSKCSTCQNAAKWLKNNGIEVEVRDIVTENPTFEELSEWVEKSTLSIPKFFNTSGLRYKELGLKHIVKTASKKHLLELLSSEGKLVKRPLLITDNQIIVGFNEKKYLPLIG